MPQNEQETSSVVSVTEALSVESQRFDFTSLPKLVQEQIVNGLGVTDWFAFMQASKESLAVAFNQNAACQRIVSVLMTLTTLDGISLELLLTYFRASPVYQELSDSIRRTPETVSATQWLAYIHSAASIEQVKSLSRESSFYKTAKELINSQNYQSDFKEFVILTQHYLMAIRDDASLNFIDYFYHALHQMRMTQLTQPLPEFDQVEKIVSTLKSLTESVRISESIEAMTVILGMGLTLVNGMPFHDKPLPRLMLMGLAQPSNIRGLDLSQSDLCYANLQHADLSSSFLYELMCRHADFRYANLRKSYLGNADFYATDLRRANLQYIFFMLGSLSHANLSGALLQHAYLGGANLTKAIAVKANLRKADLSLVNASGANFFLSNMQDIIIKKAELDEANLKAVNMTRAILSHVKMTQVDLTGANLTKATLIDVDLSGAILVDINLQDATLKRVTLVGAKVLGVKKDHLLDIDLLRARLDVFNQMMIDKLIPTNFHGNFKRCATYELINCIEANEEISPHIRIECLQAAFHHPVFEDEQPHKIKKVLNYPLGLFAPNKVEIKSRNQQIIEDCLTRLRADIVIRPEC